MKENGQEINADSISNLSADDRQKAFSCLSNFFRDGRPDAKAEYKSMCTTPETRYKYMAQFIASDGIPGKKEISHSVKTSESIIGSWKTLPQLKGPLCFNSDADAELYAADAEWKYHDVPHMASAKVKVFRYFDNYVSRENTAGAMKKDSDSKRPAEEAPSGTNLFHICLISLITENVLDPLFRLSFLSIS